VPPEVPPKPFQIEALKRIFKAYNPDVDVSVIDWEAYVDSTLSIPENRLVLAEAYPAYRWFRDESERASVQAEAQEEVERFLDFLEEQLPEEYRESVAPIIEDFRRRMREAVGMRTEQARLRRELREMSSRLKEVSERLRAEEERRRREAERALEEERRRLEEERRRKEEAERRAAVAVQAVQVAPPPVKEAVERGEMAVSRDCYDYFSKLWNAVKKGAAMEVAIPTVSSRTGFGADLIRRSLSYAQTRNALRIEELANKLFECECLRRKEKEKE
jgi:Asp-tRNA(Asn)/Glu-tRNA(Gln) amidotransferase A subunit family amidase